MNLLLLLSLHCALSLAAQCIVIGPVCDGWALCVCGSVCVCMCVCAFVCLLTRGSAAGRKFLSPPYYSQRAVFASLRTLFSLLVLLFRRRVGSYYCGRGPLIKICGQRSEVDSEFLDPRICGR